MITLVPQPRAYAEYNEEVLGKNAMFLFEELCRKFKWVGRSNEPELQPYVACDFNYTGLDGLVVKLRMSLQTMPTEEPAP